MKQCLMLAAGLSSRMGQWKMMLPLGKSRVLDSALTNALGFCDRVVLVTGYRSAELEQRYCTNHRITLCHNPLYRQGMFSSIRCGARLLAHGPFFVAPGDMPVLPSEIYAALWQQRDLSLCLVPEYDGGCGHPLLLPADMRPVLLAASPEDNLKRLSEARGRRRIAVDCAAIHWDLDTPAHYQQLCQFMGSDRIS